MKTSRTSNRRAVANARRSFLAVQKPVKEAAEEKLSSDEESKLYNLIDDAHASNRRLVKESNELDEARRVFKVAKINLEIAEADLANERVRNQRIHAEMAPLFHRLTA